MGKRHQRERARISAEVGRSDLRQAQDVRANTERRLAYEESMLGSPEQVQGVGRFPAGWRHPKELVFEWGPSRRLGDPGVDALAQRIEDEPLR